MFYSEKNSISERIAKLSILEIIEVVRREESPFLFFCNYYMYSIKNFGSVYIFVS